MSKSQTEILMELMDSIPDDKTGDETFNRFAEIFEYEARKRKKRAKEELSA